MKQDNARSRWSENLLAALTMSFVCLVNTTSSDAGNGLQLQEADKKSRIMGTPFGRIRVKENVDSKQDDKKKDKKKLTDEEKKKQAEQRKAKAAKAARERLEKEIKRLKKSLNSQGIQPTRSGIRNYLIRLTSTDRDWTQAQKFIDQLDSPIYAERVNAQNSLLSLPEQPVDLLQAAIKSGNQEKAYRARAILKAAIPQRRANITNAFRLIEISDVNGLIEEVFAVAQLYSSELSIVDSARKTVAATAKPKDFKFLETKLANSELIEPLRVAAMSGMQRLVSPSNVDAFDAFARANELPEKVRVMSAMTLANVGDRRSLELLLGFMDSSELSQIRSKCYVAMRKLTGQDIKYAAFEKPDVRTKQIADWRKWIADNSAELTLNFPLDQVRLGNSHLNGNTLLALGYTNKVIEIAPDGEEVWSYDCKGPWSAEKLANGNYLIAEYQANRVIEVSPEKEVVREISSSGPLNARYLENGNILVSSYSNRKVIEFDENGDEVWSYTGQSMVGDAVRLANGNTLVCEYTRATVVDQEGDVIWEFGTSDNPKMNQIMGCQALDNGNFLLTSMNSLVVEVSREKKIVWQKKCNRPSDAFRLENGNTLITETSQIIEVDPEGEQVWSRKGNSYGTARR